MNALDELLRKTYSLRTTKSDSVASTPSNTVRTAPLEMPQYASSANAPTPQVAAEEPSPPYASAGTPYVSSLSKPIAHRTRERFILVESGRPEGDKQEPEVANVPLATEVEAALEERQALPTAMTDSPLASTSQPMMSDESLEDAACGRDPLENLSGDDVSEWDQPARVHLDSAATEILTDPIDTEAMATKELSANERALAASGQTEQAATEDDDFRPEWEIDRFPWPEICEQLSTQLSAELQQATESITTACASQGTKTVLLTSVDQGVGRTTLALCLARAMARQGKSVAVVDLDHQHPTILQDMGIEFDSGLESLGQDDVSAESICVTALEDGVTLIPAVRPFAADWAATSHVSQLLQSAARHHDLVIIDASAEVAELVAREAEAAGPAVIFVSHPESEAAIQELVKTMQSRQAFTLGVIDNFAA